MIQEECYYEYICKNCGYIWKSKEKLENPSCPKCIDNINPIVYTLDKNLEYEIEKEIYSASTNFDNEWHIDCFDSTFEYEALYTWLKEEYKILLKEKIHNNDVKNELFKLYNFS